MPPVPRNPPRIAPDLDRGPLTAFIGDSIEQASSSTYVFAGDSYPTLIGLVSGGRIRPYIQAGIGGQTTTQILARLDDDVINAKTIKPARCIVGGGTNDTPAISGAATEAARLVLLDTTLDNIAAMYDRLRGAGIEPIGRTLPPRASLHNAAIAYVNAGIRRLCERRGMHCLDFHTVLCAKDGSGDYVSGYSADGVHPGPAGVRAIASYVNSYLAPRYPLSVPMLATRNAESNNLIDNGLFLTDGNSDGIADSWSYTNISGGTVTPTIETGDTNIVGNWQVFTTTVSGHSSFTQLIGSSEYSVGDVLEFTGIVTVVAEAGSSGPTIRISYGNGTPYTAEQPLYRCTTDVTRGVFSMRCTVPSGTTSCSVQLYTSETSPRGTGTFKVAQLSLYNLTKLGIA